MRKPDCVPVSSSLLAVAGMLALLPAEGAAVPFLLTAAGVVGIWALLERVTSARIPRSVARAADLVCLTSLVVLAATYFSLRRSALLTIGHVLAVAQLSRVFRRKRGRDLAVLHGTAVAQVALAAFLTRDPTYLPLLVVTVFLGISASIRVPAGPDPAGGGVRVFVARPRGGAGVRARAVAAAIPLILTLSVLLGGTAVFVLLPRGPPFVARAAGERALVDFHDPTDYSRDVEDGVERVTGFTERVRLGEVGRIKLVPREAFRVALAIAGSRGRWGGGEDLYFRGAVLDRFDGVGWSRSAGLRARERRLVSNTLPARIALRGGLDAGAEGAFLVDQQFVMRATNSRALVSLGEPVTLVLTEELPRVRVLGGGAHAAPRPHPEGFTYRMSALVSKDPRWPVPVEDLSPEDEGLYLSLPEGLDRLTVLAREVIGERAAALDAADAISAWLDENCDYTLAFTEEPRGNPLLAFLFETKAGHCEYFATAQALLLRAVGVPTRLVAGYRGGQWIESERSWYVTMDSAHAWVEAHVRGRGWVRLDPTPSVERAVSVPPERVPGTIDFEEPGITDRVLDLVRDYGPEERSRLLSDAGGAVAFVLREGFGLGRPPRGFPPPLLVLLAGAVGAFLVSRLLGSLRGGRAGFRGGARARPPKPPRDAPFYREALRSLERRGVVRRGWQTPREVLRLAVRHREEWRSPLARITRVFEEVRYGRRVLSRKEERELRGVARGLAAREVAAREVVVRER